MSSFSGNKEFLSPRIHITISKSLFPPPLLGLYRLGAVNLCERIESQRWFSGDFGKLTQNVPGNLKAAFKKSS